MSNLLDKVKTKAKRVRKHTAEPELDTSSIDNLREASLHRQNELYAALRHRAFPGTADGSSWDYQNFDFALDGELTKVLEQLALRYSVIDSGDAVPTADQTNDDTMLAGFQGHTDDPQDSNQEPPRQRNPFERMGDKAKEVKEHPPGWIYKVMGA